MMHDIVLWFMYFIIYSVIGYLTEVSEVSVRQKKVTNRGYLFGPLCPIYGFGALIMLTCTREFTMNPFMTFLMAMLTCTVLEYFTSFIMEKIFKVRWWDYSDQTFNINGRVCLQCSILFGVGGLIIIYFVHPIISGVVGLLPTVLLYIIAAITFMIFMADVVLSTVATFKVKDLLQGVADDVTAQAKKFVSGYYFHHSKVREKILEARKKK